MLRLLSTQGFHELYRCSHLVAPCVTKRQLTSFLPVCHHRVSIPARHLCTGSPVWKDALQPKGDKSKEIETVDLDKWKSVMRSKAASGEKQANDEGDRSDDDDDDDESFKEPGGDLKDSSSLEATRDLVVMWRHAGRVVPHEMTDEEVQTLAQLTTRSARKKYLKFLAIKESHKNSRKQKKEQRRAEREAELEQKRATGELEELKNTFLLQYWDRSLDKLLAWRSAQAMRFGQPLVFDLSYDSSMTRRELQNTVSQLIEVEGWNRRATEPYHLHYCNLQSGGAYEQELLKRYSRQTWDHLLITCTDRQHVDLFPREQLVYLTADSPNILRTFDHSKIYIIGAMVDRHIQPGLSLANAKRLNLATARLPLSEILHWQMGAKNLTLDQMYRIMLTLKDTGKWEEAFKFVPQRKHDGFYQEQAEKVIVNNKVRGFTNHGPREDGNRPLRSGERNKGKTFENVNQSFHRSHKEPKFTGRDTMARFPSDREKNQAVTRVRLSLKSNMEAKKKVGKSKMWWDDK